MTFRITSYAKSFGSCDPCFFMSDASCPELKELVFRLLPVREQFEVSKSSQQWRHVANETLKKCPEIRAAWSRVLPVAFAAQNIQTLHFRHSTIDIDCGEEPIPREIEVREEIDCESLCVLAEDRFAVAKAGGSDWRIYDISKGILISTLEGGGLGWISCLTSLQAVSIAAATHTLLNEDASYDLVAADEKEVVLYNVESGHQVAVLKSLCLEEVHHIARLSSGTIIVGRANGTIEVVDPANFFCSMLYRHPSKLTALATCGERVISGHEDGSLIIYDVPRAEAYGQTCVPQPCYLMRNGQIDEVYTSSPLTVKDLLIHGERIIALCTPKNMLYAMLCVFDLTTGCHIGDFGGDPCFVVPCSQGGTCMHYEIPESLLTCGKQVVSVNTASKTIQVWSLNPEQRRLRTLRESSCLHNTMGNPFERNPFARHKVAVFGESVVYAVQNQIQVWDSTKPDQPPQIIKTGTEETIYGIACTASALLVQYLNRVDVYDFGILPAAQRAPAKSACSLQ